MKKILLFVLISALALSLNACGGNSTTKINVNMTEFKYDMENYTVAAGQEITMNVKNDGLVIHEFVIMKKGLNIGDDFGPEDEENIYWEVEAEPGESKTVTFTAPADLGEYQVVCGTEGHFKAGMASKLTVVSE